MIAIKFYSETCGSCKLIEKELKSILEKKFVTYYQINAEKSADICHEFNIKNLPTVVIFEDGKELNRFIGYKNEQEISKWLEKLK